jgi:hypothetical protein
VRGSCTVVLNLTPEAWANGHNWRAIVRRATKIFSLQSRIFPVEPAIMGGVAPERLVKWATAGVERLADAASLHVLGLSLFRSGRYAEAIETLQQSNAGRGWSQQAKSQNWLVLARWPGLACAIWSKPNTA